ncbi:hypothetical protein AHAS_Ahas20G0120700 [Arachis hypogaea]
MNLFGSDNGIVKFNGLNYDWFEQIQFQLGTMDLDLALVINQKPTEITEISSEEHKCNTLPYKVLCLSHNSEMARYYDL